MEITPTTKKKIGRVATTGLVISLLGIIFCVWSYVISGFGTYHPRGDFSYVNSAVGLILWAAVISGVGLVLNIIGFFTSQRKWLPAIGMLINLIAAGLIVLWGTMTIASASF